MCRELGVLVMCAALTACGGGGENRVSTPVGDPVDTSLDNVMSTGAASVAQTDQILVRLVADLAGQQFEERAAEYARTLSLHAGVALRSVRQTGGGSVVMALPKAMGTAEVAAVIQRLKENPAVAYAEPDARVSSDAVAPNDTRWGEQWSLAPADLAPAGVQTQAAWTLTSGNPSLVVAVLDTGMLPHIDLQGRVLPGYDFVSDVRYANDGNGRDADASDPGDWVDGSEDWLQGDSPRSSGWHGTHVAGIIAAQRNNATGISGVDAQARLLPVRVLGRGGGYMSDVADGLLWAVGAPVTGAPLNPHPARVANLSLGGSGRCSREMQNALDEARARGVVVVVSAGNLAQNVSDTVLASCQRLVVTASVGKSGEQASYSNFGAGVTLAAPGGNAASDPGILSLGDNGKQGPALDNAYRRKRGTSMAAPHVAGTVALMLAANPGLTPVQVEALLKASARPFVTGTGKDCVPERCGAGMLDTAAAVSLAALFPAQSPLSASSIGAEPSTVVAPAAGWWRDTSDATHQVFVDMRGDEMLLRLQFRGATGQSSWGHARLVEDAEAGEYVGRLIAFDGGGTLTGDARSPRPLADLGEVRWASADATTARLSTPMGAWPLTRDLFGVAGTPSDGRTGVWWSDEHPGLGFLLEQQGAYLRLGVHAFGDNGRAAWYVVMLSRGLDGAYRGPWQKASEALPHRLVALPGVDSEWVWLSSLEGRLRLPNGRHITLRASVNADVAEARGQSAGLLGIWRADAVLDGGFSERWTLAHLRASEVNAGDYNVWGINQWGGTMVGGWSSRYSNHSLYAPGLAFDDFYRFQLSDEGLKGCYHYYHVASATLSGCYPFTAEQVAGAQAALSAWPTLSVGAVGDRSKEAMLSATLTTRMASSVSSSLLVSKQQAGAALAQLQDLKRQLAGLR